MTTVSINFHRIRARNSYSHSVRVATPGNNIAKYNSFTVNMTAYGVKIVLRTSIKREQGELTLHRNGSNKYMAFAQTLHLGKKFDDGSHRVDGKLTVIDDNTAELTFAIPGMPAIEIPETQNVPAPSKMAIEFERLLQTGKIKGITLTVNNEEKILPIDLFKALYA